MVTLLSLASLAAVHYFTFEHPYLLADNRHYPFYVWKNIFKYVCGVGGGSAYIRTFKYVASVVV